MATQSKKSVKFSSNDQTDIILLLDKGVREFDIKMESPQRAHLNLPTKFIIPEEIFQEYNKDPMRKFFLNVKYQKKPEDNYWYIEIKKDPK
jgi:hypothetical protein